VDVKLTFFGHLKEAQNGNKSPNLVTLAE